MPPVQVSAPGGEDSEVTLEQAGPGLWRSTIDVKAPGLYKMETPVDDRASSPRSRTPASRTRAR